LISGIRNSVTAMDGKRKVGTCRFSLTSSETPSRSLGDVKVRVHESAHHRRASRICLPDFVLSAINTPVRGFTCGTACHCGHTVGPPTVSQCAPVTLGLPWGPLATHISIGILHLRHVHPMQGHVLWAASFQSWRQPIPTVVLLKWAGVKLRSHTW
jgi:hypothetical protein